MRLIPALLLCLPLAGFARGAQQVGAFTVERQQYMSQLVSTSAPFAWRFSSMVGGFGIQSANVISPTSTTALQGTTLLMSYATNYASLTIAGTNMVYGPTNFLADYPAGNYLLECLTAFTNPITKVVTLTTNELTAVVADYPKPDPIITNIPPFAALAATQTFAWPVLTNGGEGSFVSFTLLEGQLDTNLLAALATGGAGALTNLTVVTNYARLTPAQNSITVPTIDPDEDHVALLAFHAVSPQPEQLAVIQAESASFCVVPYFGKLSWPTNDIRLSISLVGGQVKITWPTNRTALLFPSAAPDLAGTWAVLTNRPVVNASGQYELLVPADLPRRFLRLESP